MVPIAATAVGLGIAFVIAMENLDLDTLIRGGVVAIYFICLIAFLTTLNRLVFLPRTARRQFLQQKEFRGSIKIDVIPPRVALTSKNGFSETPTEDFLKWAENRNSILIYRSDRLFHFLPTRVVGDAFRRSLVAELTRAGVSKASISNS